ncbi:MAG: response regulator [Deltaproteobacteria bacterium]|nr:response regulator [Deltaproteobacteria bacterium]
MQAGLAAVLMIDDHEPDVVYTRIMLQRCGRFGRLEHLESAEEALALFEGYELARIEHPWFPPLVILLDINMPRMNGFEFLERFERIAITLRERGEEPSVVVMLSSSGARVERERAAAFESVKDFVVKPITVDKAIRLADSLGLGSASP